MPQRAVHLSRHELERFRANRSGPMERRRAFEHLLAGCEPCQTLAGKVFFAEEVDYTRTFDRVERAFVNAEVGLQAERRRGEELWGLLEPLDPTQRVLWVKNDRRLYLWGLYSRVLDEVPKALRHDPGAAVGFAHLAWMIAQHLDPEIYGDAHVRDFQGAAAAQLGNAKRLYGDLRGAAEDLERAEELLALGTGDLQEQASLLSIQASLKTDLGCFEDAATLLRKAAACARQIGDRHLEGKYLIGWSSSIGFVDPQRGLELAQRGLAHLEKGVDPHLELGARHLQAVWTNELGRTAEARRILEAARPFYARYPDPVTQGRLVRLEGLLARSEGRLEESERCLRTLVVLYEQHDFHFDLALAAVDLAEVLSLQRRLAEAAEILRGLYPVLEGWQLHGDILHSWLILQEAIRRNALQEQMFHDVAMTLRRKWLRR
jgi:tetratricopeptide (TPR) repeat protein